MKLTNKSLISSAAHITGGGLIENLIRSIPDNLSLNLDLSLIKIGSIFKWLKRKNISDEEMLTTFNCGVGFCVIAPAQNLKKIVKIFPKKCRPYKIGYLSKDGKKNNIINSLSW